MTNSLTQPAVHSVIERLFTQADGDDETRSRVEAKRQQQGRAPLTVQERADIASELYMPISRDGGQLCYSLIRSARPATVVEFGASFGISTLHLAAAVRDNGTGRVITTELNAAKAAATRAHLAEAGLDDLVEVRLGDALETLADAPDPIGFVLLDGWKELYLPVLRLLEPKLASGALVLADDSSFASVAGYLAYVRDPANGYVAVPFPVEDGIEIGCRVQEAAIRS